MIRGVKHGVSGIFGVVSNGLAMSTGLLASGLDGGAALRIGM